LADPRACLVITEPDSGRGDPQTLARISIQGTVAELHSDTPDYQAAKDRYLARLPDAELWFQFADFVMFRLAPQEARYIGGFAQARSLSAEELRACG
jgi:putative heme iron utilization protein